MRTTVDIDAFLLSEIRDLQKQEGRSFSKIVSELLAEALAQRRAALQQTRLDWISRPRQAQLDLSDKEILFDLLDRDEA